MRRIGGRRIAVSMRSRQVYRSARPAAGQAVRGGVAPGPSPCGNFTSASLART
jgi:hypothetical protein